MVVFAGQGDARRTMALLWRTDEPGSARTGPGPRPGLSVDAIVDAAIGVADEQGMAALSMRAVGERLGRTAMALYTYVPSKSELVDLMHDRALAELPTGYDLDAGWRAAATRWAEDAWDFYLRHPWVLQVSQARPVLGPHEYAVLEALLRILRDTGLEPPLVRRVVGTVFQFVRAAAQTVAESRQAGPETGVEDTEWWYTRSALMAEVAPDFAERYPTVHWLNSAAADSAAAAGDDDDVPYLVREAKRTFEVGLTVLLDGVEARIRPVG
ncbi:TetR/AcrR family transcriptional regulator [Streptomyces sp. NPDC002888]|uniref:TetR/AcrR family transcriptional regulator n=1 Tax=Streptomyces sp. NPDC002888 TaxID=3364668 RepID=UPI0036921077